MSIPRGTTPTFHLTFSEEELDLTAASNVYVTFKQNEKRIITKSGEDLVIAEKQVDVYLNQKETLSFTQGDVKVQVNWTLANGRRAASEIKTTKLSEQLLEKRDYMITVPMEVATDGIVVPVSIDSNERNIAMGVEGGIVHSSDYNLLSNRPKIEGVTLEGNKTFEDLNLQVLTNKELEDMLTL